MAENLLSPLSEDRLYRLHLWGPASQGGGVDELIGRAAHISMMDSTSLVPMLLCTLLDLIE
ncbi:unnamed protein product [Choristocarpus tenellus]